MWRDSLEELSDKILAHPDFDAAARRYVAEYLDWRDGLGILNKVVPNAGRLRVLENLIYLHFIKEREGGTGATFERLVKLSGLTDDVGARAVRTLLRLAQIGGLVVGGREPADARLRVYQPTEALLQRAREYTSLTLRPLDAIFPHLRICERLAKEPSFYGEIAVRQGRFVLDLGLRRSKDDTPFSDVMRLDGAMQVYCVVVNSHFQARNVPAAAELSRRFLVSQSQVRAVLRAAEAQRLMQSGPRGRLVDAGPLAKAIFQRQARILAFACRYALALDFPGA